MFLISGLRTNRMVSGFNELLFRFIQVFVTFRAGQSSVNETEVFENYSEVSVNERQNPLIFKSLTNGRAVLNFEING